MSDTTEGKDNSATRTHTIDMGSSLSCESEPCEDNHEPEQQQRTLSADRHFKIRDPQSYEVNPELSTGDGSDRRFKLRRSESQSLAHDDSGRPTLYADRQFKLRDPKLYESDPTQKPTSGTNSTRFKLRRGSLLPAYEDLYGRRNDRRFKLRPEPGEQTQGGQRAQNSNNDTRAKKRNARRKRGAGGNANGAWSMNQAMVVTQATINASAMFTPAPAPDCSNSAACAAPSPPCC